MSREDDCRLKPFDPTGDVTSVGPRWKRWKRSFEYYVIGKGITDDDQKTALFMHLAGEKVQDIFEGLAEPGEVDEDDTEYEKTVRMLDEHFIPQANVPFERHVFRQMSQENSETIDQFVCRLRTQANNCDFGLTIDENIRDQVIDKCKSTRLRMKLLSRGTDLKLKDLQDIARAMETAELQSREMESSMSESLNAMSISKQNTSPKKSNLKCYRCGREGHISRDSCCPARNAICRKCKKEGHFEKVCRTKVTVNKSKVNEIEEEPDFAFVIDGKMNNTNTVNAIVGGVLVKELLIDSGATCNIINKGTWEYLKENKQETLRLWFTQTS